MLNTYTFYLKRIIFSIVIYKNNLKIIPHNLDKYLTPLALATLFIFFSEVRVPHKTKDLALFIGNHTWDLPIKHKSEINASLEDLKYLSFILRNKYNIDTIIKDKNLNNANKFKSLYIKNSSISTIYKLVKPHLLDSQYNLLNLSPSLSKGKPN